MSRLLLLLYLALAGIGACAANEKILTDSQIVVNYAVGPLTIGREFTVSVTLNKYLAQLPGTRLWFVIREDYNAVDLTCKGNINGTDFPFILLYQIFGQLPGAPDYRQDCEMYNNITVLEDTVEGNKLSANLKINDTPNQPLGRVRLVCLFVDHPPASIHDGMIANGVWARMYSRAKPVYDYLDQRCRGLPEEKWKELGAKQIAALDALGAQDMPDDLRKIIRSQIEQTIRSQHGVKLRLNELQYIDAEHKAQNELLQKANYYAGIWTSILMEP